MPRRPREGRLAELNKLKMMSPMSAEATVVRNYIDWLVKVPWKKRTKVRKDLARAEQVLDEDHYGLEKVKERILEYLAVQQRVKKLRRARSCAWSARRASARPRSARASRGPPTASSCA
jgi:ATP-dependent Lon protease